MQKARIDGLPEGTTYVDSGCSESPSCLSCPLPVCRHEIPGGLQAIRAALRKRRVAALKADGLAVEEIAETVGVSKRSVWRMLET